MHMVTVGHGRLWVNDMKDLAYSRFVSFLVVLEIFPCGILTPDMELAKDMKLLAEKP